MEPNLASLALFINTLIAAKALSMVKRTRSAWALAALSITLSLRFLTGLDWFSSLHWHGLSLGALGLGLLMCAAVAVNAERLVSLGAKLMALPVLALIAGLLEAGVQLLPAAERWKEYPPSDWGYWPLILLAATAAAVLPRLGRFRSDESLQYFCLLPALLALSVVNDRFSGIFYFPAALAVEAWCELGVLVLARTTFKGESFGRLPMFLVMVVVPFVSGLWAATRWLNAETGTLQMAAAIGAGMAGIVAAVLAVLLREEVERHVTQFFSPDLQAARERTTQLEKELNTTRETLRQTEREALLGEVVLSVAHQIKNPLGPMKGYAQMLEAEVEQMEKHDKRERMKKGLRIILTEIERVDRQVRDLLNFAGKTPPRLSPVDVNHLLERALLFVAPEGRGIVVRLDLLQPLPQIHADPDRLHEAFLNLILNAVEAMESQPTKNLHLETTTVNGGIRISIEDTGIGIAHEDQEQIYEPFFSRRPGGFGLGLAVVRSVIDESGGRLTCHSEVGKGTTFEAWLPKNPEKENQDA